MGPVYAETVLDFIAYCLWRDFQFHQWLLFNGDGRNGKGVTLQLITKFLGHRNVSNESLHRLLENRFASANLYGKMAKIDADLSSEALSRTGLLKKITGAGLDEITGEFKFKTAFSFKNYAKLIFSANKIPATPDETNAFFARLLIVNFPNQFLGNKANSYLIDELTTESEMSSFLSLILKIATSLKNGITSQNSSIKDNYLKYMQSLDPIALFIDTAIQRTGDSTDYVTKDDLYTSYERFCFDKGLAKESSGSFSRRMKAEGFDDDRLRINGGVKAYVWKNIELKNYAQVDEDEETL